MYAEFIAYDSYTTAVSAGSAVLPAALSPDPRRVEVATGEASSAGSLLDCGASSSKKSVMANPFGRMPLVTTSTSDVSLSAECANRAAAGSNAGWSHMRQITDSGEWSSTLTSSWRRSRHESRCAWRDGSREHALPYPSHAVSLMMHLRRADDGLEVDDELVRMSLRRPAMLLR